MDRPELIGDGRRGAVGTSIRALNGWLVPNDQLRRIVLAKEPCGNPSKFGEYASPGPIVTGIDTPDVGLPWLPKEMQPFAVHTGE